ncbi:MAG: prepilin-type N-terminal cleavage/methylation domain-containing protein [Thermodesulfobacteriota bacterium]
MRIDRKITERDGFTLIELLIVIAIIAILVAIAIPQFSSYRSRSVRASMIVDARNASIALEAYWTDWDSYPSSVPTLGPGPDEGTWGGNMVRVSKGNTMSVPILSVSTYRIQIDNNSAGKSGADIDMSPMTLDSTGICQFFDGSTC